jgi:hypothetical protein
MELTVDFEIDYLRHSAQTWRRGRGTPCAWTCLQIEPLVRPQSRVTVDVPSNTQLPILKPGSKLQKGDIYLDLNQPERSVFRALDGQVAAEGNAYLGYGTMPPNLWNDLVRVCARARLALEEARKRQRPCQVTITIAPAAEVLEAAA